MKAMKRPLYLAVRGLAWAGCMPALAEFYASRIAAATPARFLPVKAKQALLALNPDRFRGDLEALAETGQFRVYTFPFDWQCRILSLYWHSLDGFSDYFVPPQESIASRVRRDLADFLRRFLPHLFKRLGADGMISAGVHYRQDVDYGEAAASLGYPYVVFHRENFLTNVGHVRRMATFFGGFGRFRGNLIVTHNEPARQAFIGTMAAPDQVRALGCLRMDRYVKRVQEGHSPHRERRLVTLFSFTHFSGLYGLGNSFAENRDKGFVRLFDHVHGTFAALAAAMPEVDFVIKPKWGGRWLDQISSSVERAGLRLKDLANLQVTAEANAQDLILSSDVVVSFGSTTALEAAVAGIPVIIPFYYEARNPQYSDYIHLMNDFSAFDVAQRPEELELLVRSRLADPHVPKDIMTSRWELFEKYVSSSSGEATERYVDALTEIIATARRARRETL